MALRPQRSTGLRECPKRRQARRPASTAPPPRGREPALTASALDGLVVQPCRGIPELVVQLRRADGDRRWARDLAETASVPFLPCATGRRHRIIVSAPGSRPRRLEFVGTLRLRNICGNVDDLADRIPIWLARTQPGRPTAGLLIPLAIRRLLARLTIAARRSVGSFR